MMLINIIPSGILALSSSGIASSVWREKITLEFQSVTLLKFIVMVMDHSNISFLFTLYNRWQVLIKYEKASNAYHNQIFMN